ncbi:MAG: ABC transporter ATP-binding protein [Fervidicoccaceae archaeon]
MFLKKASAKGPERMEAGPMEGEKSYIDASNALALRDEEKDASKKELIKLEEVHKIYRQGDAVFSALRGVSLTINEGDFIAIMGPSGSGKSTLLNIMGLLDRPTRGRIYIEGKDVSKLNDKALAKIRNQKIGFVFQFFNLINRFTIYENIELPLLIRELSKKERKILVESALIKAGGELIWLQKRPNQLSGGQQQRVAIARALVTSPKVILADEPTGNLDRKSGRVVMEEFVRLNSMGQTIVVVTHDPEVANCSKKIIYLRNGEIVNVEEKVNFSKCLLNTTT